MSILEAVYLVAGLASIGGLLYAIIYARRSRRIKFLVYDISSPVPLAITYSLEDDYKLAVTYKRKGFKEERIESVYTRFLRFVNAGREPIRHEDITRKNPVRIKVDGVRTLNISLVNVTRPVNNIRVAKESLYENRASADITFDYLDHNDGGLIKILTVGGEGRATLSGDIIGMPDGIKSCDEISAGKVSSKIAPWLAGLFVFLSFVVSIYAYSWITGSWQYFWVITLPLIALIVPAIIIAIVAWAWPGGPSFPSTLNLPDWVRALNLIYLSPHVTSRIDTGKLSSQDKIRHLQIETEVEADKVKRLEEENKWLKRTKRTKTRN